MSSRKRTKTQTVGDEFTPNLIKALESAKCSLIFQESISLTFHPTRVLLRRVFFVNEGRSRYVSVGFYPARNYQVLVEIRGPRIISITLTEQHVRTLEEHLPKLCEAMGQGGQYVCKDDVFRLETTGNYDFARMYIGKQFLSFKLMNCAIS